MTRGRYVEARVPWKARFDPSSRAVRRFLAELMNQSVRYGMPGIRRYGIVHEMSATFGAPQLLTASSRLWRKTTAPEIDTFLEQLRTHWDVARAELPGLPASPPALHGLLLERRSAGTLFVFAADPQPLLVAKLPRGEAATIEREHAVLQEVEPLGVAPKPGPRVGEGWLQEALPGKPPQLAPLPTAAAFTWSAEAGLIADAVLRLGASTARDGQPIEADDGALERALTHDEMPPDVRAALEDSVERWRSYERVVLKHGDLSPQNCLFESGRLSGIVDWATATSNGAPCFDHFNLGISVFEHRLFLRRRAQAAAAELFERSWRDAPFFRSLRETAAATLKASGVDDDVRHTEIVFFGRRFGQRLRSGAPYALGAEATLKMLTAVVRSH